MRNPYPTESFYHKAISALLALVMHGGLLFFLFVGVQWATVSNAPLSAQLWSSSDLLSATAASPSQESILVGTTDTASETVDAEPVESTPTLPDTDTKPLIEPTPISRPATTEGDINIETEKEKEKKPEQQKPEVKPATPADNAKPNVTQKPENTQAQQQRQREQALKDRLARERAALASDNQSISSSNASGGGSGSGGTNAAMLIRAEQTYKEKIRAIILANTTYPPNFLERLDGNPQAVFVVKLLSDGTIGSVVLRQSSGYPTFDRIVSSAIDKTGKLPLPERAEILPNREVILSFRPRDN